MPGAENRTAYDNVSEAVQILENLIFKGTDEVKRLAYPIAHVVDALLKPCLEAWEKEERESQPDPEQAIELVPEIKLDDAGEEEQNESAADS